MKKMTNYKILVIDDDASILRLIKNALEHSGFEVTILQEIDNVDLCFFNGFDLILLDIMMPIDGLEICQSIREQIDVPIIFVTAKQLDEDLLSGIKVGADDYIKKPFSIVELVARVKMHIRREQRNQKVNKELLFGDMLLDANKQEMQVKGDIISLTKREFLIIYLLASNPSKIFSIEEIFDRIYPSESEAQFRSISEYIYQIRSKLKPYSINPIKTQWGGGYRWNDQ
ncbi:MAG: response regulator transcription factor [Streptococcus sp.]|nr:response regulator transcription factor [Streptococcus sp.]